MLHPRIQLAERRALNDSDNDFKSEKTGKIDTECNLNAAQFCQGCLNIEDSNVLWVHINLQRLQAKHDQHIDSVKWLVQHEDRVINPPGNFNFGCESDNLPYVVSYFVDSPKN